MKKPFLATTAVVALTAGSASTGLAADWPLKAPDMMNATPATSWGGLYFGGAAGMGLFASEFTDFGEVTTPKTITNKGTTFNVGGTAGYNWQLRSAVFGLEADGSWTNYNQTTVGHPDFAIQAKTNWFSTVRIRAGLAADNILFYVTGGAAFADYKNTAQFAFAPSMCGERRSLVLSVRYLDWIGRWCGHRGDGCATLERQSGVSLLEPAVCYHDRCC